MRASWSGRKPRTLALIAPAPCAGGGTCVGQHDILAEVGVLRGQGIGKVAYRDLTPQAAYSRREKEVPTASWVTIFTTPRQPDDGRDGPRLADVRAGLTYTLRAAGRMAHA